MNVADLRRMLSAYCDQTLTRAEHQQLEELLLSDANARAEFRRYLALDAALREHGSTLGAPLVEPALETSSNSTARRRTALWGLGGLIATLALTLLIIVFNRNAAIAHPIGELEQTVGDVRLIGADGQVRSIESNAAIGPGDTVRTHGSESSTVLVYPDGTRLTLVGNTSITCGDRQANSLIVHQGTLAAAVEPQSTTRPLLLATPAARLEVVGTRFQIEALEHRTNLSVTEGLVRVVRIRDGDTVDVPDGKCATVTEKNQLQVRDIPHLPAEWEMDFEHGLPEGWRRGEWTSEGLPAGSRGAVKATYDTFEDGSGNYAVLPPIEWLPGLFAVKETSHLQMTFKMAKRPNWLNALIVTRTADVEAPRFSGNYIFTQMPRVDEGKWYTITIPLSSFKRIHRGDIPLTDVVPYTLSFDSDEDHGLVVDRIAVLPDGPGELVLREVE